MCRHPLPPCPRRAPRILIEEHISIPPEVIDLDSFCRWAISEQYPERGQFSYLRGVIWVDLSMEKLYSHNRIKTRFTIVLGNLVDSLGLGMFLSDGMLLRNSTADLSTEPDSMFVSYDALSSGRVQRIDTPDCLILEGSPEMVLEVVSETSVRKDTEELRELYWRAGILEYWLVDARAATPRFDLLHRGRKGYTATRKQAGGWRRSNVFDRSFQLTKTTDPLGDPLYVLNVRPEPAHRRANPLRANRRAVIIRLPGQSAPCRDCLYVKEDPCLPNPSFFAIAPMTPSSLLRPPQLCLSPVDIPCLPHLARLGRRLILPRPLLVVQQRLSPRTSLGSQNALDAYETTLGAHSAVHGSQRHARPPRPTHDGLDRGLSQRLSRGGIAAGERRLCATRGLSRSFAEVVMLAALQTNRTRIVLCLVSAGWAFSFGLSAPLASFWLSDAGYRDSVVGLNTGVYYLGIAMTALAAPRLMRRWGRGCPTAGFVLSGAAVMLFPWGGGLFGWFALRLFNGIGGALSLIPLETYVNRHSPPEQRSRNFGFYAVAIAIGWALGNLIGLQMYDGAARSAFVLGGTVPLLALPFLWHGLPWPSEPAAQHDERLPLLWRRSLLSFGSGWVQGFLEGAMVSLLPIYLIFTGLSKDEVGWLTSGIMIGVILFQVPVAWLADRLGRAAVLLSCHALVLAGLIALPFCSGRIVLSICLFLVGACSGAFYPLGLSLLGEQVRDAALPRASACYLALNCLGSLIGPIVTGMVMDGFGKAAMPASGIAACMLVLSVWLILRQWTASANPPLRYVYQGPREAA